MTKRENPASKFAVMFAMLILALCLVPIIVDQVQTIDVSGWNFTGYQGAVTLFHLLPFVFIVGIVLFFIASLLKG